MNHCRYCAHLGWPELDGTAWEPIQWFCSKDGTYSEQPQQCESFSREAGSDDDRGAIEGDPLPMYRVDGDRGVEGRQRGLDGRSRGRDEVKR